MLRNEQEKEKEKRNRKQTNMYFVPGYRIYILIDNVSIIKILSPIRVIVQR